MNTPEKETTPEQTREPDTVNPDISLEETVNSDRATGTPTIAGRFDGGRYEVVGEIGEGGQKKVVLAHDTQLERNVVIAILKSERLDAASLERIRSEARTMARIDDHPHIVSVFDIGDEKGVPYVVTQHIQGGAVSDLLEKQNSQPLALNEAIRIAEQTCQALDCAHRHDVIHRDVKPSNIWLTHEGEVKLGDFGLAAVLDRSRLAGTGVAVGTAAYMPPEQAVGADTGPASDLYSLGVMLYEMVTGRRPFVGETVLAVVSQHLNADPAPPSWHNPHVPESLDSLILQLLAKVPEDRPRSAAAVRDVLLGVLTHDLQQTQSPVRHRRRTVDHLAGGMLVGRSEELASLCGGVDEAISGQGKIFAISGEAGSGKTRLAEEVRTYARLRNVEVLMGRCYQGEGAPAYWPWVQVIRAYADQRESNELLELMGAAAADIARLDSKIQGRLGHMVAAAELGPEQARFRLFDGITAFLSAAARKRPLLLFVDDLQWADEPSLRLLRFLAHEIKGVPLLVLGTCRQVQDASHPLAKAVAELEAEELLARIELKGLSADDVAEMIRGTARVEAPTELVTTILEKTEGNPFFVSEVIRLLVEEGRLAGDRGGAASSISIPEGVRDVIGRRLSLLSDACYRTLKTASVVGRDFSADLLARLGKVAQEKLPEVLAEAEAARILMQTDTRAHYSFTHDLLREALYEELSVARRVRLHARIGHVLEEIHNDDPESHLSELAHHFFRAAQVGEVEKAIDYSARASAKSMQLVAYEEAVRFSRMALDAFKLTSSRDDHRRCTLELALAEAQRKAGNLAAAMETFESAAVRARSTGTPESLALAVLGFEEANWQIGTLGASAVQLAEDAVAVLEARDSPLRARTLRALSRALRYAGSLEAASRRAEEAVEMARRVGDPELLVFSLHSLLETLWGPENAQARLKYTSEMMQVAERATASERSLEAYMWRLLSMLELGDIAEADAIIAKHIQVAAQLRLPFNAYISQCLQTMQALLGGQFEDASRHAKQARKLGQRVRPDHVNGTFSIHMFTLCKERGRLAEVAMAVNQLAQQDSDEGAWQPALAVIFAELDFREKAEQTFAKLSANNFRDVPRDGLWSTSMCYLTEVCRYVGDAHSARRLYELLEPYAELNIAAGGAVVCYGAASRYLGLLASTMLDWDLARKHFEHALAMNDQIGARPYLAHTQHEYAELLLSRDPVANQSAAEELLSESIATARALGMQALEKQIASTHELRHK